MNGVLMKTKLFTISALTLMLLTSTYASEKMMKINAETIHKATYINMISTPDSKSSFEQFLKEGAQLVRQTEPDTALWFALKDDTHLSIFDVFFNEKGREQHFAGQVANALKINASHLVQGGWEQGVLHNINNYNLVSSSDFNRDKVLTAQEASYITFKAKSGKNLELELLLKEGAKLINATEPETYFWIALKTDNDTYAIFDAFQNKAAQKAHFSGKVASALQQNAQHLIEGGWEQGVVPNVHNFQIIASS